MNNDLISRETLKEKLKTLWNYDADYSIFKQIETLIDNAPTVKTYCYFCGQTEHGQYEERPQGEWIIIKDEKWGDNVKCPFCGKELAGTDLNFCCKCGADMRGDKE